ncbi:hypothetical protein H696_00501 [Fonticula alba]|uniref:PH domain-containing protein n=1 Tax=Fonticula alba TaxID=691883 RepID=A0A058ZG66_FONAL|nr:hypothetical protein H696_00501 [Fonticula alba]KCV72946.1 hypothetical protein H696_00501 [Fonticula alba]|eukprot:XP_009492647.1 hypothetical protein H696_00501 [Fonticula alba]
MADSWEARYLYLEQQVSQRENEFRERELKIERARSLIVQHVTSAREENAQLRQSLEEAQAKLKELSAAAPAGPAPTVDHSAGGDSPADPLSSNNPEVLRDALRSAQAARIADAEHFDAAARRVRAAVEARLEMVESRAQAEATRAEQLDDEVRTLRLQVANLMSQKNVAPMAGPTETSPSLPASDGAKSGAGDSASEADPAKAPPGRPGVGPLVPARPSVIATTRQFLSTRAAEYQGYLFKQSRNKSWKSRYFVLRHQILWYFKSADDVVSGASAIGHISLSGGSLLAVLAQTPDKSTPGDLPAGGLLGGGPGTGLSGLSIASSAGPPPSSSSSKLQPFTFELHTPQRVFHLASPVSDADMRQWVRALSLVAKRDAVISVPPPADTGPLANSGDIITQGWLIKHKNGFSATRWVVLKPSGLYYYRSPRDERPVNVIHLTRATVVELVNPDNESDSEFDDALTSLAPAGAGPLGALPADMPEHLPHHGRDLSSSSQLSSIGESGSGLDLTATFNSTSSDGSVGGGCEQLENLFVPPTAAGTPAASKTRASPSLMRKASQSSTASTVSTSSISSAVSAAPSTAGSSRKGVFGSTLRIRGRVPSTSSIMAAMSGGSGSGSGGGGAGPGPMAASGAGMSALGPSHGSFAGGPMSGPQLFSVTHHPSQGLGWSPRAGTRPGDRVVMFMLRVPRPEAEVAAATSVLKADPFKTYFFEALTASDAFHWMSHIQLVCNENAALSSPTERLVHALTAMRAEYPSLDMRFFYARDATTAGLYCPRGGAAGSIDPAALFEAWSARVRDCGFESLAEAIPLLVFTREPLLHPLSTLFTPRIRSEALKLFRLIQRYASTLISRKPGPGAAAAIPPSVAGGASLSIASGGSKTPATVNGIGYHIGLARSILQRCVAVPELRSEVYLQLIKQSCNHPYPSSAHNIQIWHLIAIMCGAFLPQRTTVRDYLLAHLQRCAANQDANASAMLAAYSLHTVQRLIEAARLAAEGSGRPDEPPPAERALVPSRQEILAVINVESRVRLNLEPLGVYVQLQMPVSAKPRSVDDPDVLTEKLVHVALPVNARVSDLIDRVVQSEKLEFCLTSREDYGLFLVSMSTGQLELPLSPRTRVADLIHSVEDDLHAYGMKGSRLSGPGAAGSAGSGAGSVGAGPGPGAGALHLPAGPGVRGSTSASARPMLQDLEARLASFRRPADGTSGNTGPLPDVYHSLMNDMRAWGEVSSEPLVFVFRPKVLFPLRPRLLPNETFDTLSDTVTPLLTGVTHDFNGPLNPARLESNIGDDGVFTTATPSELELLYGYYTHQFTHSMAPVAIETATFLVAVMSQAKWGDYEAISGATPTGASASGGAASNKKSRFAFDRFLPMRLREESTMSSWSNGFHDNWRRLKGRTAHQCMRIFLGAFRRWRLCGSSFFAAEAGGQTVLLAVRHDGISLMNPDTLAVVADYQYDQHLVGFGSYFPFGASTPFHGHAGDLAGLAAGGPGPGQDLLGPGGAPASAPSLGSFGAGAGGPGMGASLGPGGPGSLYGSSLSLSTSSLSSIGTSGPGGAGQGAGGLAAGGDPILEADMLASDGGAAAAAADYYHAPAGAHFVAGLIGSPTMSHRHLNFFGAGVESASAPGSLIAFGLGGDPASGPGAGTHVGVFTLLVAESRSQATLLQLLASACQPEPTDTDLLDPALARQDSGRDLLRAQSPVHGVTRLYFHMLAPNRLTQLMSSYINARMQPAPVDEATPQPPTTGAGPAHPSPPADMPAPPHPIVAGMAPPSLAGSPLSHVVVASQMVFSRGAGDTGQ